MIRQLRQDLIADKECFRQSFLSRALCAYYLEDKQRLNETLKLAAFRPDFQELIRALLKIEIHIADSNQQSPILEAVAHRNASNASE